MVKKIVVLTVSFIGSLYPIVSYRLFHGPEGRRILVLGEYHDRDFSSHVKRVTDELAKLKFSQPVPLVMPIPETDHVITSHITAQMVAFAKGFPRKVSLKGIEPRGEYSDAVNTFLDALISYCKSMDIKFAELGSKYPYTKKDQQVLDDVRAEVQEKGYPVIPTKGKLTVGGYLKEIQNYVTKLEECKARQSEEIARAVYEEYILRHVKEAAQLVREEFACVNPAMQLREAFGDMFFRECTTPTALYSFYEKFNRYHFEIIDSLFFNGILFDYLLSQQTSIICCVGDTYAAILERLFNKVPGWTLQKKKTIFVAFSSLLKGFDNKGTPDFLESLSATIREYVKPFVRTCAVCPATEYLKECGRCRSVYYCSAECQRKAWQEHKAMCVPVKVKISS